MGRNQVTNVPMKVACRYKCKHNFRLKDHMRRHKRNDSIGTDSHRILYMNYAYKLIFTILITGRETAIYQCHMCKRCYRYKSSLSTHIKFDCGKEPTFKCEGCKYKCKHKGNLKIHMHRHGHKTISVSVPCKCICGNLFSDVPIIFY